MLLAQKGRETQTSKEQTKRKKWVERGKKPNGQTTRKTIQRKTHGKKHRKKVLLVRSSFLFHSTFPKVSAQSIFHQVALSLFFQRSMTRFTQILFTICFLLLPLYSFFSATYRLFARSISFSWRANMFLIDLNFNFSLVSFS